MNIYIIAVVSFLFGVLFSAPIFVLLMVFLNRHTKRDRRVSDKLRTFYEEL